MYDQTLASQFEHFLNDLPFPLSKDELLKHARAAGSGQDLVDIVNQLPAGSYPQAAAVLEHLGFPQSHV